EVDECQHRRDGYTPECEMIRMKEIVQSIGMHTTFIRYNPDSFLDSKGVQARTTQRDKERTLLNLVAKYSVAPQKEKLLRVHYLFYDGHNGRKPRIELHDVE